MKKQIFKLILPLLLMAILVPSYATNGSKDIKKEFVKKIERSFDISASGTVKLHNKHGKVDIKTGNGNKVEIEVSIVVKARSESAAQEAFDRISIEFDNATDFVKAETMIESKKSSWLMSNTKTDFQINYLVRMPKTNDLNLFNKYGHSYVENIGGDVEADIKYGDLNMAKIGGKLNLTLGYGNGGIESSQDAKIDLKYGSLRLNRAGDIDVESKYSTLTFTEVGDVRSNSKYDNYEIGTVKKFRGDGKYDNYKMDSADKVDILSKYANVTIGQLTDAATIEISYGSIRIKSLSSQFSEVNLKGKHSEFKVGVDGNTDFTMDLSVNYGDIDYPEGVEVLRDIKQSHSHSVKGYRGSENAKGNIKVATSYGNVKIY